MRLISPVVALLVSACGTPYLGPVPIEVRPSEPTSADDLTIVATVARALDSFSITARTQDSARTYTAEELDSEPHLFEGRVYTLVIPSSETSKGQTWTFEALGRKGRGEMTGVEELTINNSPPTVSVELTPEAPIRAQPIQALATAEDLDGDEVSFTFSWEINGAATDHTGPEFPAMVARRNDRVTVTVVGFDGEDESEPATANATLRNSPPVADVYLTPEAPDTTHTLIAHASGTDADDDPLTFDYSWEINGEQLPQTTPELPSQLTRRDDVVRVRVVARDGRSLSEAAYDEVEIQNSPPSAPTVQIVATEDRVSSFAPLVCEIVVPSIDPDRDPITYEFIWYRNDEEWTGPVGTTLHVGDTIEEEHTDDGDLWSCAAFATDGAASSSVALSNEVEVVPRIQYKIPIGQLVNQGSDCSRTRDHKYNGCSGNYGFYWVDDGGPTPRSITVEYNHGINCGTGNRTAFLNGTSIGTADTGLTTNCSCDADAGTWVREHTYTATSSYRSGARNDFTMSSTSCEGFSANSDWRDGDRQIFAIVTVTY